MFLDCGFIATSAQQCSLEDRSLTVWAQRFIALIAQHFLFFARQVAIRNQTAAQFRSFLRNDWLMLSLIRLLPDFQRTHHRRWHETVNYGSWTRVACRLPKLHRRAFDTGARDGLLAR